MNDTTQNVRAYYDSDPEREWDHLERHPFEFKVTMHYLERYLAKSSNILDAGGGPGRYAIELASKRHRVTLLDLADGNIKLATQKASEREVSLAGFHVGEATDLSLFGAATFDAVLCMGPMYHLTEEHQRIQAMKECLRVLKPGGLVVVSFVSSYAPILDSLNKNPSWILQMQPDFSKCNQSYVLRNPRGDSFTDAFYIEPHEISSFMTGLGVRMCALIGAEGLTAQSESAIVRCGEETTKSWIALAIEMAQTDAALGSSIHVVYFGRKSMEQ